MGYRKISRNSPLKKHLLLANAFIFSGALMGQLQAFDYEVKGEVGSFTKWGFNNTKLDIEKSQAPTESFTTLIGKLDVRAELIDGLSIGLGGSIAGLAYDSTRALTTKPGLSPVQTGYFGVNNDYGDNENMNLQNYIIHNANIKYANDRVYLQLGRFENGSGGKSGKEKLNEYFSGYVQGAEGYVRVGDFKIWGFWADRRALAYSQWFYNFFRVHGVGKDIYAVGVNYEKPKVTARLFNYYIKDKLVAPGLGMDVRTDPSFKGEGVASTTKIRALFPQAQGEFIGKLSGRNWGEVEKSSASVWLNEQVDIDNKFFGVGVYKNFGNANEYIARYGNPLLSIVDTWTASVYDIGQALSDMWAKDAFSGYGYFGINHGSFSWRILARATNAPRSAEQSIGWLFDYKIRENFSIGGKVEWLSDTTKAGYNPLYGLDDKFPALTEKRTDDRSHLFFYMSHTF